MIAGSPLAVALAGPALAPVDGMAEEPLGAALAVSAGGVVLAVAALAVRPAGGVAVTLAGRARGEVPPGGRRGVTAESGGEPRAGGS